MIEPTELLRYTELQEALQARGVSKYEFEKLIQQKILVGESFRPGGRKFYHWSQAIQVLKLDSVK